MNIDAAVDAAFQEAALARVPAESACLAVAGTGREADRARVLDWARQRSLAKRVDVVHDAEPLLAAGTPEGWGIAIDFRHWFIGIRSQCVWRYRSDRRMGLSDRG